MVVPVSVALSECVARDFLSSYVDENGMQCCAIAVRAL